MAFVLASHSAVLLKASGDADGYVPEFTFSGASTDIASGMLEPMSQSAAMVDWGVDQTDMFRFFADVSFGARCSVKDHLLITSKTLGVAEYRVEASPKLYDQGLLDHCEIPLRRLQFKNAQ